MLDVLLILVWCVCLLAVYPWPWQVIAACIMRRERR